MKQNIMIQGTMSSAGKSLICAALCHIFTQDGFKTAPFKSQNMALNSFITEDGAEMGRAQVMQAEAAKIRPDARMNPILLKPTSDVGSQVIVNGHVLGNMPAASYFKYKKQLVPEIMKAYRSLEEEYDIIVIEGAGSPAEINLKKNDIVNMGMAKMVDAPVLLAGDIDRGGVFAQLYGTVALLEEEERKRVKGLIINKFRGDVEILKPGLATLEELTKIPVAGVIPWIYAKLDDEDSLAPRLSRVQAGAGVDIAVVRLPHISNFTDFNPLEQQPGISLRYAGDVKTFGQPDMVIVPGSKNTMSDLKWMRQNGMEAAILKLAAANVPVLGICGGYQMLGESIEDPGGEEEGGSLHGMGLLPVRTVFGKEKVQTRVTGEILQNPGAGDGLFAALSGSVFSGYEIHMGHTTGNGKNSFSRIRTLTNGSTEAEEDWQADGAVCGNVAGTYVHGLFEDGSLTKNLCSALLSKKGICAEALTQDYAAFKESQYDLLAAEVRKALDMEQIYRMMEKQEGDR